MRENTHSNSSLSCEALRIILPVLVLIHSGVLHAADEEKAPDLLSPVFKAAKDYWLTIYPGLSIKSPNIGIKRKSDGQYARLTGTPGVLALDLNIKLKDFDFFDTNWGFTVFAYSSYFKVDEQFAGVDGAEVQPVDLGTSIAGYYTYVVPAIYYRWNRETVSAYKPEGKIGFGIGRGSANFEGNAVFGPSSVVSSGDPKTAIKTHASDVFAFTAFYNLEWNNRINFRVAVTSLRFEDAQYDYEVTEFSIILNRRFSFF